jgi:phosphatidylglycerophosphatase A
MLSLRWFIDEVLYHVSGQCHTQLAPCHWGGLVVWYDAKGLNMNDTLTRIATLGPLGRGVQAPGTAGSLAALPVAWVLNAYSPLAAGVALAAVFVLSIIASEQASRTFRQEDPSAVIIDEVVGMWIAVLFFNPSIKLYLLAFVLFRFFDILKPWPVRVFDRKFSGGLGITLDDVAAGTMALILILIMVEKWPGILAS